MTQIIRIYADTLPGLRFSGIKYNDEDRDENCTYTKQWLEWRENNLFSPLEKICSEIPEGCPKIGMIKFDIGFEYWIGMFTTLKPPAEYQSFRLPAGNIAVCHLQGKEATGELFGMKPMNDCMNAIRDYGWTVNPDLPCFELYSRDRYYKYDKDKNVILDYCFYLK